jgi:hypothetical protein
MKMHLEKLISLIYDIRPNNLVDPLIEHLSFLQDEISSLKQERELFVTRVEILENQVAKMQEHLMSQGLGTK